MKTKICTKCKEEKNISSFNKNSKNTDSLHHWCKECYNEYQRESFKVPYCKMREIHVYDSGLNLVGFYHNVVEAVMYHPNLTAVDIYRRCRSEKVVNRRMFSFKGYMPYSVQKELKPFIDSLSA